MNLQLEILDPFNKRSLTHQGSRLRLGRDPACDLSLNGDSHQGVSWSHAQIDLTPAGAFLSDLKSSNGTFLNDRRITEPSRIKAGDHIRLGQTSPAIKVVALDLTPEVNSAAPQAIRIAAIQAGHGRSLVQSQSNQQQVHASALRECKEPSTTRRLLVGFQRNNRKVLTGAGLVLAIGAVIVYAGFVIHRGYLAGLSVQGQETRKELVQVKKQVEGMSEADAAAIFKQFGDAVHYVREIGATAFAIDESGIFATNAHVAEPAQEFLLKGLRVELISQGGRRTYPVVSASWHRSYQEEDAATPDVGILRVRLGPGERIPVVVKLASEQELRDLEVGSPLCYIGFPSYHPTDYTTSSRVAARVYQGRLNRMLTLSKEAGTFEHQQLVEHDMLSWGGSSGSPIFNKKGRVVAVHHAGSRVSTRVYNKKDEHLVINSPASAKWGMRVDLLRELLSAR